MIILFCGCSYNSSVEEPLEYIKPPPINRCPIEGTWKVTKCTDLKFQLSLNSSSNLWLGKTAQFTKGSAVIGDYLWRNPHYKLKKVLSEDFFLYNYKMSVPDLGISNSQLEIVSVSGDEKFAKEFVKISEEEMFVSIDDTVLFLKKTSDKAKDYTFSFIEQKSNLSMLNTKDLSFHNICLLIGFRTTKESTSKIPSYSYKTIMIAYKDRKLQDILQTKDIILPRRNGFWKVIVKRDQHDKDSFEDLIYTYRMFLNAPQKISFEKIESSNLFEKGKLSKTISFIGNDYISLDINLFSPIEPYEVLKSNLRLQPIDSIHTPKGVKISDLFANNGSDVLRTRKENFIKNIYGNENVFQLNPSTSEENIGLYRKAGHWYMEGRVGIIDKNFTNYHDYKLNLLAPSEIVYFDKLCLPWQKIKDKIPWATDVYTSPNRKIAVVITQSKLSVYEIDKEALSPSPLAIVNLNNNDTVIMAEWADGNYVDIWHDYFLLNEYKVLNY